MSLHWEHCLCPLAQALLVAGCKSVEAVKWMGVTGQQCFLRQCCSSRSQGLTQARS